MRAQIGIISLEPNPANSILRMTAIATWSFTLKAPNCWMVNISIYETFAAVQQKNVNVFI